MIECSNTKVSRGFLNIGVNVRSMWKVRTATNASRDISTWMKAIVSVVCRVSVTAILPSVPARRTLPRPASPATLLEESMAGLPFHKPVTQITPTRYKNTRKSNSVSLVSVL